MAFVLLVFLLLALVCRLWIEQAGKKIELKITEEFSGLYPGQKGQIVFYVKNNKLIPVFWADLFYPLSIDRCIVPQQVRASLEWEKPVLNELNAYEEEVGESHIESLSWYESRVIKVSWTAVKRGIYSNRGWSIRTGDGFGLGQKEQLLGKEFLRDFAVFPKQIPVNSAFFMKNVWNSDTGIRGILEDNTVIRSVRDYMPGDSVRHINWRLTARGLPLSVNVYEEILPQNAFIIFDGESFSGPDPHPDEMEEALSIIGSAAAALAMKNIRCGLCLSRGDYSERYADIPVSSGLQDILWALAAFRPSQPVLDEGNKVVRQRSVFDHDFAARESHNAGKCYYIAYDLEKADQELIRMPGEGKTVLLSYIEDPESDNHDAMDIRRLLKSGQNTEEQQGGT